MCHIFHLPCLLLGSSLFSLFCCRLSCWALAVPGPALPWNERTLTSIFACMVMNFLQFQIRIVHFRDSFLLVAPVPVLVWIVSDLVPWNLLLTHRESCSWAEPLHLDCSTWSVWTAFSTMGPLLIGKPGSMGPGGQTYQHIWREDSSFRICFNNGPYQDQELHYTAGWAES